MPNVVILHGILQHLIEQILDQDQVYAFQNTGLHILYNWPFDDNDYWVNADLCIDIVKTFIINAGLPYSLSNPKLCSILFKDKALLGPMLSNFLQP